MPVLPTDGASGWGDTLNAYLSALITEANNTQNNLNAHASNSPPDPHGDRTYTQSQVSAITTGVNGPNGFVKTNASGAIPKNLIATTTTGGMYSGIIDAMAMYGATPGTSADQSGAIQAALNAASSSSVGVVYLGPGTFSLANYLYMPSNTWLLMTPETILQRIPGSPNPAYMITNIQFNGSALPATNICITGGKLDAYGSKHVTSACTPIFVIQSNRTVIEDVSCYSPFNAGPAIEINGCANTIIRGGIFDGQQSPSATFNPAIRLNVSSSATTPSGLASSVYNNAIPTGVTIAGSSTVPYTGGLNGTYASLVGSDKTSGTGVSAQNVTITGCSTTYPSTTGPVFYGVNNWSNVGVSGNAWFEASPDADNALHSSGNVVSPVNITSTYTAYSFNAGTMYTLRTWFTGTWGGQVLGLSANIGGQNLPLCSVGAVFGSNGDSITGWMELTVEVISRTVCTISLSGTLVNTNLNSGHILSGASGNAVPLAGVVSGTPFTVNETISISAAFGGSSAGQTITTQGSTFTVKYPSA